MQREQKMQRYIDLLPGCRLLAACVELLPVNLPNTLL